MQFAGTVETDVKVLVLVTVRLLHLVVVGQDEHVGLSVVVVVVILVVGSTTVVVVVSVTVVPP